MATDVLLIGTRPPWSNRQFPWVLGIWRSMFVNSAILALTCSRYLHLNVRGLPAWNLQLFKLKHSLRRHTSKRFNKRLVLITSILSAVFRCGSVPSLASSKKLQVLSKANFGVLKLQHPGSTLSSIRKYPWSALAGDWQESRCLKSCQARLAEELRIELENQSRELRNMLYEEEYQARPAETTMNVGFSIIFTLN